MRAAADAELQGDPQTALRHYESIARFTGSMHHRRLRLLAEVGDDAPGWLWARWLTVQARRPLWTGSESTGPDPALETALKVAYPHGIDLSHSDVLSLDVFVASLYERDWVTRQLIVYESGGLGHLVDELAGPRLLEHADQPAAWVSAPMGGYRLESDSAGGSLMLTDLADGQPVEILDLGLAMEHAPGTHLLGRLVPTRTPPGRMFEWRPLRVDPMTARKVAANPATWLEVVAEQAATGALPMMFSYLDDDTSMAFDIADRSWLGLLETDDIDRIPTTDGLIDYADVALAVLPRVLWVAEHSPEHLGAVRHYAEALLLEPGVCEEAREHFGGFSDVPAWRALAGVLREPARSRCLELARSQRDCSSPEGVESA
ncbi:hypothetical protein [Nocardioides mesophilus]|uniref:Uncharacterized protein n=1 Tax=Nocardioides mesophilus TaxID=433659 RepID=A0A7G9R9P4_9ACTN|nr:hypothetical protein [Nocardioides mesophilus]QNN52319.1 hypothetical protein H9L09_17815 [Nocardioides mesophilus]